MKSGSNLERSPYGLLLAVVVTTGFVGELLNQSAFQRVAQGLGYTVVLIVGFSVLWGRRNTRWLAAVLAVPALLGLWLAPVVSSPMLNVASRVLLAAFLVLTAVTLVLDLAYASRVSANTLYAAICAYFLIALVFAVAYGLVERLRPGSFTAVSANLNLGPDSDFIYFSLVTIATLGYGDIAPVAGVARVLASLEAVVGQFFVAALVARLVGLMVAPRSNDGVG